MHLWSQKGHWVTVIKCMSSGQIFPEKFVWSLSPHITGRKKIGGFQRLTSVLWWWLTAMGTRRKGGLGEEWDWRRLLFEGRESDSPESAGVWLCYSHCFLAWFESPLCVHWVTLVIASWTSWGERCRQVLSALRASVTALMEGENEMPVCWCVKLLWKRRKPYLMQFFHLYSGFCRTAVLCLAVSFRSLLHRSSKDFEL